jgi:hypothetical protein
LEELRCPSIIGVWKAGSPIAAESNNECSLLPAYQQSTLKLASLALRDIFMYLKKKREVSFCEI